MRLLKLVLALLFIVPAAQATVYTVKAGGGGNYTTISACAAVAVAGDTCQVYAGSYAGWTQAANGSAGNLITFTTNGQNDAGSCSSRTDTSTACRGANGDAVTVTSSITISSRSYLYFSGFTFSSGGFVGNGTTAHNTIIHNTSNATSRLFQIADGLGTGGSDNIFSHNVFNPNTTSNVAGIYLYGDRNRIEWNEYKNSGGDCQDIGGMNLVVRYNYCHGMDGAVSLEHIDFIQIIGGGTTPTLSFSLVENNWEQDCTNDGGNCHFIIVRTGTGPVADTNIIRFNYAQNLNGSGGNFGGVGDNVPNNWFYNNTIATGNLGAENGDCASWQNAANGYTYNNICYQTDANGWSPWIGEAGGNANIAYNPGYSGTWNAPYSAEATYATLRNQNPNFVSYPTNPNLSAGSPAIGAGVALTTASGSGSSSTTLTVANAHGFQPGWAGASADWIRIGASNTAQIASIDYTNNIITLATPTTWSNGDPVYLYKDSNGTVVLNGSAPDLGAFPYVSGSQAATPTFAPAGGTYATTQNVTPSTTSPGAIICFTIDGTVPQTNGASGCTNGTLYSSPISISYSLILKAVAGGTSYTDSTIASASYTITSSVPPRRALGIIF